MAYEKYTSQLNALSYDYMKDGSINPTSCLRFTQAIGELWGFDKGFYVRDLMANGRVLMLADSVCEFGNVGNKYEGRVVGEYWPNKAEGRLIKCSYRFTTTSGDLLFAMANYYIVVDLKERKALYPNDLGPDIAEGLEECPVENASFNIDVDLPLTEYEKRVIRRGETDVLGHVNNTCYAAFATDTFSGKDFERGFKRMVIRYLAEIKKGEEVSIMKGEDDEKIIVKGINKAGKTSFEILFERR